MINNGKRIEKKIENKKLALSLEWWIDKEKK